MPGSKNIRQGLMWLVIGAVLTGLSYIIIPGGSFIFFYGALLVGGLQLIVGFGQSVAYSLKGEEGQKKAKAKGLMKAIVESMVSVALADGEVKEEEVKSIVSIYKRLFHHEISEDAVWSIVDSVLKNVDFDIKENLADVKSILDVGCGIGGNADYLHNKGYHIETLSPDDFQRTVIDEKFKGEMKFHHCKFEKFDPQQKYDLILESESACYIKIDQGFEKARETLRDGGYLLASDYFVHHRDGTKNPHLKSSHDMDKYLSSAAAYGFELIKEYDQTENTMPTLDYGKYFIERFINPSIEYGIYSAKKNYPKTARIVGKLMGPKFEAKMDQMDLLDSGLFRKYRKYMIYLFQKKNV